MELYNALKNIVSLQSADILKDARLVNILSDFKAYEEFAAAKFVIKSLISEGLMAKFILEGQSQNDIETTIATNKQNLVENYGFKEGLSEYVLRSIAYAMGWTDETPTINTKPENDTSVKESPQVPNEIIDDGKHLLFKQFPITGDVNTFINLLVANGYRLAEPYNYTYNAASLIGSFAGNNECHVAVLGTPKTKIACTVMVFLGEHHVWYSIKGQYEKIKNQLSKKYGTPETHEFFLDPYYEGDGSELTALYSDHCTYMSMFNTPNGKVSVSMTGDAKILIAYQDNINNEIKDSEVSSIADDDL